MIIQDSWLMSLEGRLMPRILCQKNEFNVNMNEMLPCIIFSLLFSWPVNVVTECRQIASKSFILCCFICAIA